MVTACPSLVAKELSSLALNTIHLLPSPGETTPKSLPRTSYFWGPQDRPFLRSGVSRLEPAEQNTTDRGAETTGACSVWFGRPEGQGQGTARLVPPDGLSQRTGAHP